MGKSEWEWGIRGLWRPIYSVISQLTVLAMAGLPESLLKTWQGRTWRTDCEALVKREKNARGGRNGEKEESNVVGNWRKKDDFPQSNFKSLNRMLENFSPCSATLYKSDVLFYSYIDCKKYIYIYQFVRRNWDSIDCPGFKHPHQCTSDLRIRQTKNTRTQKKWILSVNITTDNYPAFASQSMGMQLMEFQIYTTPSVKKWCWLAICGVALSRDCLCDQHVARRQSKY